MSKYVLTAEEAAIIDARRLREKRKQDRWLLSRETLEAARRVLDNLHDSNIQNVGEHLRRFEDGNRRTSRSPVEEAQFRVINTIYAAISSTGGYTLEDLAIAESNLCV